MRFRHGDVIGEIDNLPGCSQIAVLHSVFIPAHLRGVGKGKIAHAERLVEADHLGYDACLCTVNLNNTAQLKILNDAGWLQVFDFISSKTDNHVGVFMKEI